MAVAPVFICGPPQVISLTAIDTRARNRVHGLQEGHPRWTLARERVIPVGESSEVG